MNDTAEVVLDSSLRASSFLSFRSQEHLPYFVSIAIFELLLQSSVNARLRSGNTGTYVSKKCAVHTQKLELTMRRSDVFLV
jgi:hypothetical protein